MLLLAEISGHLLSKISHQLEYLKPSRFHYVVWRMMQQKNTNFSYLLEVGN